MTVTVRAKFALSPIVRLNGLFFSKIVPTVYSKIGDILYVYKYVFGPYLRKNGRTSMRTVFFFSGWTLDPVIGLPADDRAVLF